MARQSNVICKLRAKQYATCPCAKERCGCDGLGAAAYSYMRYMYVYGLCGLHERCAVGTYMRTIGRRVRCWLS